MLSEKQSAIENHIGILLKSLWLTENNKCVFLGNYISLLLEQLNILTINFSVLMLKNLFKKFLSIKNNNFFSVSSILRISSGSPNATNLKINLSQVVFHFTNHFMLPNSRVVACNLHIHLLFCLGF